MVGPSLSVNHIRSDDSRDPLHMLVFKIIKFNGVSLRTHGE